MALSGEDIRIRQSWNGKLIVQVKRPKPIYSDRLIEFEDVWVDATFDDSYEIQRFLKLKGG